VPTSNKEFALYCCDLLAGVGPCRARSMFGGFGISTDGLTIALMADLGQGDRLWLKANDETAAQFKAAGGAQFLYPMKGQLKGLNFFTAPDEAMESPALMLPWARLALQAALTAQAAKAPKEPKVAKSVTTAKTSKAAKPVTPAKTTKAAKATNSAKAKTSAKATKATTRAKS
jgi:DNA transformation protein and related proteins